MEGSSRLSPAHYHHEEDDEEDDHHEEDDNEEDCEYEHHEDEEDENVRIQKLNLRGVNVTEGGFPRKSLSIVPLLESLSLTLPPPHTCFCYSLDNSVISQLWILTSRTYIFVHHAHTNVEFVRSKEATH